MNKTLQILVACVVFGSGCMGHRYGRLAPVDPKEGGFVSHTSVKSLRPTLVWKDKEARPETRYDIAVWNFRAAGYATATQWLHGEQLYLRENIPGTSHTLEESLAPDSLFVWSIREHGTTNWAVSLTQANMGPYGTSQKTHYFVFRTLAR